MCIGVGPRTEKLGNLNGTKFSLLSLTIKNDLGKVWKARNKFKLVGLKMEKMAPARALRYNPQNGLNDPD